MLSKYLILIIGSSSGIGRKIALEANKNGARVIVTGRDNEKLKLLQNEANNNGIYIEPFDLISNIDLNKSWIFKLVEKYGKLNSIVLSAGIQKTKKLTSESFNESLTMFLTNYFSQMELCKGFLSKRSFNNNNPSITWISSITSVVGSSGIVTYSATKGAINAAIRSLAIENSKNNVRVNAILPGLIKTPLMENETSIFDSNYFTQAENDYPLGLGQPLDIANLALFLISDKARWITGQTYVIDGGRTIL